jgi:hypothetical protein
MLRLMANALLHALSQIPADGIPLPQLEGSATLETLKEQRLVMIVCTPDGGLVQVSGKGRKVLAAAGEKPAEVEEEEEDDEDEGLEDDEEEELDED